MRLKLLKDRSISGATTRTLARKPTLTERISCCFCCFSFNSSYAFANSAFLAAMLCWRCSMSASKARFFSTLRQPPLPTTLQQSTHLLDPHSLPLIRHRILSNSQHCPFYEHMISMLVYPTPCARVPSSYNRINMSWVAYSSKCTTYENSSNSGKTAGIDGVCVCRRSELCLRWLIVFPAAAAGGGGF